MKIYKYDKAIKKATGLSIEPKDYMHIAILSAKELNDKYDAAFVYIWDTRETLDFVTSFTCPSLLNIAGTPAIDNGKPLAGAYGTTAVKHTSNCGLEVTDISDKLFGYRQIGIEKNAYDGELDERLLKYRSIPMLRIPYDLTRACFNSISKPKCRKQTTSACNLEQTVRIWSHHNDFGYYKLSEIYNWLANRYNRAKAWQPVEGDGVPESFRCSAGFLITGRMQSKEGHRFEMCDNFITYHRNTGSCYGIVFETVGEACKYWEELTGTKAHTSSHFAKPMSKWEGRELISKNDISIPCTCYLQNMFTQFADNDGKFVDEIVLAYPTGSKFIAETSSDEKHKQYAHPIEPLPMRMFAFHNPALYPKSDEALPVEILDTIAMYEWAYHHSADVYAYQQVYRTEDFSEFSKLNDGKFADCDLL